MIQEGLNAIAGALYFLGGCVITAGILRSMR